MNISLPFYGEKSGEGYYVASPIFQLEAAIATWHIKRRENTKLMALGDNDPEMIDEPT